MKSDYLGYAGRRQNEMFASRLPLGGVAGAGFCLPVNKPSLILLFYSGYVKSLSLLYVAQ